MNFDARDIKNAASRQRLSEVVALLVAEGWTNMTKPDRFPDEPGVRWHYVPMRNPEGLAFDFMAGSWNRDGMITAKVAHIEEDGLKVGPGDVARGACPEASANHIRAADVILKDFKRRVLESPEGIEWATKVRDGLERLKAQRARLRSHIAALAALGYTQHNGRDNEYYSATLYSAARAEGSTAPSTITIYENGRVTFDGTCDLAQFPKVLACLAAP